MSAGSALLPSFASVPVQSVRLAVMDPYATALFATPFATAIFYFIQVSQPSGLTRTCRGTALVGGEKSSFLPDLQSQLIMNHLSSSKSKAYKQQSIALLPEVLL